MDFYIDEGSTAPRMESAKAWSRLLQDCQDGNHDIYYDFCCFLNHARFYIFYFLLKNSSIFIERETAAVVPTVLGVLL